MDCHLDYFDNNVRPFCSELFDSLIVIYIDALKYSAGFVVVSERHCSSIELRLYAELECGENFVYVYSRCFSVFSAAGRAAVTG